MHHGRFVIMGGCRRGSCISFGLLVCLLVITLLIVSCAGLQTKDLVKKPEIAVQDVRFNEVTFESIGMMVNLAVKNPNLFGVRVAGYDYNLKVAGNPFLKGEQPMTTSVPAGGSAAVNVPVTVNLVDIYKTFSSLAGADDAPYRIDAGVICELPVIGKIRIPVSKTGTFPLLKIPRITVKGIQKRQLGLTGAEMVVSGAISNPNNFGFNLKTIRYVLEIAGSPWASGIRAEELTVAPKGKSDFSLPISVNYAEIGMGVYKMLTSGSSLEYKLTGDMDLTTTLDMFPKAKIPLDLIGKTIIQK